jgi:hypothetical protein
MIKAIIKKNNIETHSGFFENQNLAQDWVNSVSSTGAFGATGAFSVSFLDVSAETVQAKKINIRKQKRDFGEYIKDKIAFVNETKLGAESDVDAFMAVPLIARLRAHLEAGNLSTFLFVLANNDVSAFFSNAEKSAIVAECQSFLTKIEGS